MGLELLAQHLLGIGPGERPGNVDPLADPAVFYIRAYGGNDAGCIETGGVGELQIRPIAAGPDIGIDWIDPDGVNFHDQLPRTGG
jgi:hypothetical protein